MHVSKNAHLPAVLTVVAWLAAFGGATVVGLAVAGLTVPSIRGQIDYEKNMVRDDWIQ